jgi:hypothetical protein
MQHFDLAVAGVQSFNGEHQCDAPR